MENKRMSELPVATVVNDEDYTVIVQDGINKRANREIFKQKNYNNLNNRPYINSTYATSITPANELLQGTIQFHKISKTGKYGDLLDLPFIPTALTQLSNDGYFVQDQYYVHTDNNLTDGLLDKINTAIQTIKVNETILSPNENQEVNILVPINLTDLTNDGYFVQDPNYVHTDNNFTTTLKDSYDNLVINVNQPVSNTNKLATMNDFAALDTGYWVAIELYKNIVFDGVVNVGEEIPAQGTYAVLENTDNLTINKYIDGISDNSNIPIKEGYFVFVAGNDTNIIYYIKENKWKKIGTEEGNKVEKSLVNGNIKINGQETLVYILTKSEIIEALGYTPVEATVDLSAYYDKQQSDNRYVQKENGKELITSEEKTKLSGISYGANKVEQSLVNGNIKINGQEILVYILTKSEIIEALGYTPPTTNTTYSVATTTKDGLLSSTDKQKIDGIESTYLKKTENAISATKLKNARKINGVSFDGTADINIDIALEFFYSSIPMPSALADMYAEVSMAKIFGSGCHLESREYTGDKGNNTFRYVYNVRDSRTYLVGHVIINPDEKRNAEYGYGFCDDTRSTESRISVYDWGSEINVSIQGRPQNCKKIEYSITNSYNQYNWKTGDDGNLSYSYTYPYSSSGYYYINVRITFNDNTTVEYYYEQYFYWSGGGLACFTGETLVNTENGLRAIKELKINDKIYSKNKEGIVELKEIVKTFSHITERIYKIDIGSNIIKASWSHPFYVVDKGKVLTRNLKVVDKLQNVKNNVIEIKKIEILEQPTEVFEIKVKDNLNYFVGKENILVGCEDLDRLEYKKGESRHGVNQ